MAQGMFSQAAFNDLSEIDKNEYTNARYAKIGNETVGMPFPLFKQPAYYFTDWTPSGQTSSNLKRQMNLPTNNTLFRNAQEKDGVNLANNQNKAWLYRTQTLANNGETLACRNNSDCASWPGTTCNSQYSSWSDSKGNQGNFCSSTIYPELASGTYERKDVNQGGIGRACTTDNDCGSGYSCNNSTDIFGKNVQQTGYCAMKYRCPEGEKYLGYPYNSGIPIPPPKTQNNNGMGYRNIEDCVSEKFAQQDCQQDIQGKWFAVYPGLCSPQTNLRQGGNPLGSLQSSGGNVHNGIDIPRYATSASSSIGKPLAAFSAWNINSNVNDSVEMSSPLQYELSINPH